MRRSRRIALWGISLIAQPGCVPLPVQEMGSCPLHRHRWGTSGELKQGLYSGRKQGLTCLAFLFPSYTSVPLRWYKKSCCHIVLPIHRLPVSQWTAAGELTAEKASHELHRKWRSERDKVQASLLWNYFLMSWEVACFDFSDCALTARGLSDGELHLLKTCFWSSVGSRRN